MIVITGARGFLGTSLCNALTDRGLSHLGLTRQELDTASSQDVATMLRRVRPVAVVHLAGSVDRAETEAGHERQWRDTFNAGRVVIEQSVLAGVRHVIVPGTMEELGAASGVLTPGLPAAPISTYGLCKHLLRQVAGHWTRRADLQVDWVRPFIVYGPGQMGDMLVPYAFEAASRGTPGEFSDGTQERDFLYVDDFTAWFLLALAKGFVASGMNIHHLGRGESTKVSDVLRAILNEFPDATFRFGQRPRRPGEPALQRAPTPPGAGTSVAGWRPEVGWRDGIVRTAQWWKRGLPSV